MRRRILYAAERANAALDAGDGSQFLRQTKRLIQHHTYAHAHGWDGVETPTLPERHLVDAAREIATDAHAGQFRRDGRPYIVHPADVARRLGEAGLPVHVVAAGWLHDVVEDTECSLENLRWVGFGNDTVQIVDSVTHRDGESYLEGSMVRAVESAGAAAVKDADNQNNTSDRFGPAPAQFAKQMKRNEKYLEARRIIKRRTYETAEGLAELERQFARFLPASVQ